MLKSKFLKFSECVPLIFSQIALGYLALLLLFISTYIQFGNHALYPYEYAVMSKRSILMILTLVSNVFAFAYIKKVIKDIEPAKLFLYFVIFYVVVGLFLILNASPDLKDDALLVFQSAKEFNEGVYQALRKMRFVYNEGTGGYLFFNPQQLGLLSLERIFLLYTENIRLFYILNLCTVLLTNYVMWRISFLISNGKNIVQNYTILLSFLFLPSLFFILFVYGTLICNLLVISSFYYFIKFMKEKNTKYILYQIFLLALSVLIRENSWIAVIAFCILYVLQYIKTKKIMWLIASIGIIIVSLFSITFLRFYYQYEVKHPISSGMPMSSYVVMGISDYNKTGRIGGWWNNYNRWVYQHFGSDKKELKKRIKMDLNNRFSEMKFNLKGTFIFFARKITSIWTDPMFQSVWSGSIQKNRKTNLNHPIVNDLARAGPIYQYIEYFSTVVLLTIYVAAFLYIFEGKRIDLTLLFPFVYFIGGFLFHFFWEAKSQYVLTYVFVLIPIAVLYLSDLKIAEKTDKFFLSFYQKFKNTLSKVKKKIKVNIKFKILCIFIIMFQILICLCFAWQKKGFYCDEIFTYGLANNESYAFIDNNTSKLISETGWVTSDFFKHYVTGNKTKPFSFKAAYENQAIDVHPPLYYYLIHIASFPMDELSKWPGIVLNLILLVIMDFFFYYVAKYIFKDNIKSILAIALFSFSSAGLSSILFIRMYFFLSLILMAYTAVHIHIIKNNEISKFDLMMLSLCVVMGGLTHYYFYIFSFFMSLIFMCFLLYQRKIWDTFLYIYSLLLGFIFNINYFPSTIDHVLHTDRAREVFKHLSEENYFWLEKYYNFINTQVCAGTLPFIILCATFIVISKLLKKQRLYLCSVIHRNLHVPQNIAIILILFTYIATTFLTISISNSITRYTYHLTPFSTLFIILFLDWLLKNFLFLSYYSKLFLSAIVFIMCFFSIYFYGIDMQYPDYPLAYESLLFTRGYDALVYDNGRNVEDHYTSFELKTIYDEIYFFDKNDIAKLPHILANRQTKNPYVFIISKHTKGIFRILEDITEQMGYENMFNITTYRNMQFYIPQNKI